MRRAGKRVGACSASLVRTPTPRGRRANSLPKGAIETRKIWFVFMPERARGARGARAGGGGASDARARAMGRRAPSTRAFARARSRGEGDGSRTNVTAWMFARGAAGSFGD